MKKSPATVATARRSLWQATEQEITVMSLLQSAVSLAFPVLKDADPMLLAPILALILSFTLVGLFGLYLAMQDFLSNQKS